MHKSLDLGYHLLECHKGFYPSLSSPLKSVYSTTSFLTKNSGIFERLQADTELRLRARLNSTSPPRVIRHQSNTPIEDILIRKGKERENRIRQLVEKEEIKKINELQQKPMINPISELIIKNRNQSIDKLNNSKKISEGRISALSNSKNIKNEDEPQQEKLITIEELHTNENIEKSKSQRSHRKPSQVNQNSISSLNKQQKTLVKQLETSYKALLSNKIEEKNKGKVSKMYTDRNYIPMFSKPININRLLNCTKTKKNYNKLKDSGTVANIQSHIRPIVRPISDCTIRISEACVYHQIIQDRMLKSIESSQQLNKNNKRIY